MAQLSLLLVNDLGPPMTKQRIQSLSAAGLLVLGATIVWAASSLESASEVHLRFPLALQLYGFYLVLISPLVFLPSPIPSLGRLAVWNALGLGVGALIVGASRSGALLAIPLVCIGMSLVLWPPTDHPERASLPSVILVIGGLLAVLLPAAWYVWL